MWDETDCRNTADIEGTGGAIWRRAGAQSGWLRMSECYRQEEGLMRWVQRHNGRGAGGEVRDEVRKDLCSDDSKLQWSRHTLSLPRKNKSHPLLKPFLLCNHSCTEEITCLSECFFPPPSGRQVLQLGAFRTLRQTIFCPWNAAKPPQRPAWPDGVTPASFFGMEVVTWSATLIQSVGWLWGMNVN